MRTFAGCEIREHDLRAESDDVLVAISDFNNALRAESRPEDPPRAPELTIASVRNLPDFLDVWTWMAWDGGRVVARAEAVTERTGENEHALFCDISVLPERRRQGLARHLLPDIVGVAEAEDRRLLLGGTGSAVPAGEEFCRRLGAEAGLAGRESELVFASTDWDLIRRWADEGPVRAPGYELLRSGDRYGDDLIDEIADLYDVTNTAPRDDLDLEDEHMTPERLRAYEAQGLATGGQKRSWFARHAASGRLAGFTEVFRNPRADATLVHQGWTAVHPDHRGHALGKWLKAVALLEIREEWPEAVKVRTDNAYSNDAMLGINIAMGFQETRSATEWQVATADVRAWLEANPAKGLTPAS